MGNFKALNIVYLIVSLIAAMVIGAIGLGIVQNLPSFREMNCSNSAASGCLEWSMVLFGPLYLILYILAYAMVAMAAMAPIGLGLLLILRKGKGAPSGGSNGKSL